jgi:hypothetical protein
VKYSRRATKLTTASTQIPREKEISSERAKKRKNALR